MLMLGRLGFSLLIVTGMVTANPGICPFYPRVPERAKSCFDEPNCSIDSDCKDNEKCCENPCGVSMCSANIIPDPLVKTEKCPTMPQLVEHSTCKGTRTKFCFITECKRCCIHVTSCNPAPKLLTESKNCHSEICKKHSCGQQGAVCYVDEATNKPACKCKASCARSGTYVCASVQDVPRTFRNRCYMEKDACEKKRTFNVEYEGRCIPPTKKVVPIQSPTVRNAVKYQTVGSSVTVDCVGDRDLVHLRWVQKRRNGKEVEVEGSMESDQGVYELNGRFRKVLRLIIPRVGPGSFGIYACKQEYDDVVMETQLRIKPINEAIFNRKYCNVPFDRGTCKGRFPNYYYDHRKKRCERFNYTGCDGNANNFQTEDECRVRCGGMKPTNISFTFSDFGDECNGRQCKFYETCWNLSCKCRESCSLIPNPVCASNGRTFISLCALEVEACRWRKRLVPLYAGKCEPFRDSIGAMSQVSRTSRKPLTLCELKRCPPYAKCFIHPFNGIPQCYCEKRCSFTPRIICASNIKHYLNECFMRYKSCKEKRKLTVLKQGLCLFSRPTT